MCRMSFALTLLVITVGRCAAVPIETVKKLTPARQLQAKLAQRVTEPGFEPNTPLGEAMGYLTERYGVTIIIELQSFVRDDVQQQEPDQQPVMTPALTNIPLLDFITITLESCDGALVQRGQELWVVHKDKAHAVALAQPVNITCTKKPLSAVLNEIADQTGYNILLDTQRAGKASATPITVDLGREKLGNAVTRLADLAKLSVVERGNSLFVTTPAHAAELRKNQPRK